MLVAAALAPFFLCSRAAAIATADDQTPGGMALRFGRKSNAWGRLDLGIFDGRVKTSPPDAVTVERRVEGVSTLGFDAALGAQFAARLNVAASASKQRQMHVQEPQATVDRSLQILAPALDLTFITDKGLELFAGALQEIHPAYNQTVTSANGVSTTRFHQAVVVAQRLGVVRRTGQWGGGFYYQQGARVERVVDQLAFDGSGSTTSDLVFVPSTVGVMAEFKGLGAVWGFELAFVQARDLGPRDAKNNALYTDYFQGRGGATFDLGGSLGLRVGGSYQTLSYGNSAFVTLDTIPMSTLQLLLLFGGPGQHGFIGMTGAFGKDGQSQPQFNASYQAFAVGATIGYLLTI